MKANSKRSFLYMLGLMIFGSTIGFSQSGLSKDHADKIHEVIEPLVNSNNYSGSVLIAKDQKVVFSKSYGLLDREKNIENSAKSRFFLASASMMFTSVAIMKLVDEGKISTADKLSKFMPGFKNGDRITVHHMLAQRSGIPAIGTGGNVSYRTMTMSAQTTDQLIGYFKNYDLLFDPGAKYSHGRSEYILLVKIIEKVSGKRFGQYLREEVFEPLGMKNSGHYAFDTSYEDVPNLARGYQQKGLMDLSLAQQIHWSSKTGHASIYSTTDDLFLFAKAALNNELLTADSWDKVLTNHGESVGYGWFIRPQGKHKRYQMNGRSPGFTSFFSVFPDDDLVVIMLANTYISVPHFTAPKLASIMFNEPYEKLNLSNQEMGESYAEKVAGTYEFGPDFYRPNGRVRISFKDGRLYSDGGPLIPIQDEDGQVRRFIHRRYWSTLEFVMGQNGKAENLKFDSYKGQKIK